MHRGSTRARTHTRVAWRLVAGLFSAYVLVLVLVLALAPVSYTHLNRVRKEDGSASQAAVFPQDPSQGSVLIVTIVLSVYSSIPASARVMY